MKRSDSLDGSRLAAADLAVGQSGEDHRVRRVGLSAFGQIDVAYSWTPIAEVSCPDRAGRQQFDILEAL